MTYSITGDNTHEPEFISSIFITNIVWIYFTSQTATVLGSNSFPPKGMTRRGYRIQRDQFLSPNTKGNVKPACASYSCIQHHSSVLFMEQENQQLSTLQCPAREGWIASPLLQYPGMLLLQAVRWEEKRSRADGALRGVLWSCMAIVFQGTERLFHQIESLSLFNFLCSHKNWTPTAFSQFKSSSNNMKRLHKEYVKGEILGTHTGEQVVLNAVGQFWVKTYRIVMLKDNLPTTHTDLHVLFVYEQQLAQSGCVGILTQN